VGFGRCDRFLGCGSAISFGNEKGRSLFGMMWSAIVLGRIFGVRSFFGNVGIAIAFLWFVGVRSFFEEFGNAIALIMRILEGRSLFGCGRCDHF
jgi:hypothetical protein